MSDRYCIDGGPHWWWSPSQDIWTGSEGGAPDGQGFSPGDVAILTDGVAGLAVEFAVTCAGVSIEPGFTGQFRQAHCDTMLVSGDFIVDPAATTSLFRVEPNGVIEVTGRFLLPVNLPDRATEEAGETDWLAGGLIGYPIEVPATSYINRGTFAGRILLQGPTVTGGTFDSEALDEGDTTLVEVRGAASVQGGDFTDCLVRFYGPGCEIAAADTFIVAFTGSDVEVFAPLSVAAEAGGQVAFDTSPINIMRREATISLANSAGEILAADSPIRIDRAYGFGRALCP